MKVLVIGGGGREHAVCMTLAKSSKVDKIWCAPGNGGIAAVAGKAIKDMPYAFSSPEWSNEKGLDASLALRLFGVDSYHCVEPPVQGSTNVENFLKRDTRELLGSVMHVNVDPIALGKEIVADIEAQRQKLGWD